MRLDKFICKSTQLNRVQARQVIAEGLVVVNYEVVLNEATQVHENNIITLDGKKLIQRPSRYIMMNKLANTLCSNADGVYPSLFHSIDVENAFDLHIAGRLDADTTGLVWITDDGRWSFNIITPPSDRNKIRCEKIYRVGLNRPVDDSTANELKAKFEQGIQLQGEETLTLPAKVKVLNPNEVLLSIVEGKFHQVKRMFAAVGNRVISLHREQIGEVKLDIDPGEWRYLTEKEVQSFSLSMLCVNPKIN